MFKVDRMPGISMIFTIGQNYTRETKTFSVSLHLLQLHNLIADLSPNSSVAFAFLFYLFLCSKEIVVFFAIVSRDQFDCFGHKETHFLNCSVPSYLRCTCPRSKELNS